MKITKNIEKNYLVLFRFTLPWIPEPSTVNNKLKRREGSGSTGTDSVLKPLILFCDWRGLIKESSRWTRAFATFQFIIYCQRFWNPG